MKKRRIFSLILAIVAVLIGATGCSTPECTESGFCIEPGIQCDVTAPTGNLSYMVMNKDDVDESFFSDAQRAEEIVKKWWGNDETFVAPKWLPAEIVGQEDQIFGFLQDGYVFASYNCGRQQRMLTMVHECIHAQAPEALLWREGDEEWGRTLMEMTVEKTAVDLLGGNSADFANRHCRFFERCSKLMEVYPQLEQGFKEQKPAKDVYQGAFGKDAKKILNKIDQYLETGLDDETLDYLGISAEEFAKTLYGR